MTSIGDIPTRMSRLFLLMLACVGWADKPLMIEAESFASQDKAAVRKWHVRQDREAASGGASVKVLPDTRVTHADKLVPSENFSDEPGAMAVLHYRVHIPQPGRYFVWVRAYSTGTEDNGIHVGIDGAWPDSGRRMQWCEGKNSWKWASAQRTAANHCGEQGKIWLDVAEAGEHTVSFSMREDGFEFDQFLLTRDPAFQPRQ